MKRLILQLGMVLVSSVFFLSGLSGLGPMPFAEGADASDVRKARDVLQEISRIPETAIPPALLKNAEGIAIIPSLIKAGFIVGGRYGNGIVMVRDAKGAWGSPREISMSGVSIGWQIGVQSIDLVLVFKTRKSVEDMTKRKWTLGVDGSVAAGPIGRRAKVATDIWLKAEVFAYSRSRGIFAGISVDGGVLEAGEKVNAPDATKKLIAILSKYTNSK
ncbi:MAG: lipid-binding SYLF domain-containing protein [bacterium]